MDNDVFILGDNIPQIMPNLVAESNNGLGMIVGFGAGYYLGSSLYRWTSDNFR